MTAIADHLHRAGCGIEVVRRGRLEPFLGTAPTRSSTRAEWTGIVLEDHAQPACVIAQHEHREHFLHFLLEGEVDYEVRTRGRTLRYRGRPGTAFLLPRGTVDELTWKGPTRRLAVAIHSDLLTRSLDDAHGLDDIELSEHWNLDDPHIAAVLRAMVLDLEAGSPAGRLYGESLASSLAVYLLGRYTTRRCTPAARRSGLSRNALNRVIEHIDAHLADDLPLADLAGVANLSTHYFAEQFRKSTGDAPHRYVLARRIERAKTLLRDPRRQRSVIDAALETGFRNASHFARVFRRIAGTSPSEFHAAARRAACAPTD